MGVREFFMRVRVTVAHTWGDLLRMIVEMVLVVDVDVFVRD